MGGSVNGWMDRHDGWMVDGWVVNAFTVLSTHSSEGKVGIWEKP